MTKSHSEEFSFKDLNQLLDPNNCLEITQAIDDGYDSEPPQKARNYIGASNIGHPCDALLSFSLRGFPETSPDARLKRIFKLGHILEDVVIKDMKEKGDIRVWEKDGLTGRQHAYNLFGGHVNAHLDGHVEIQNTKTQYSEISVLEVKSMNDASWKKYKKYGVRKSHPRYFAQCQMMMGMSGLGKTLFIAYNKNDSSYWIEVLTFDELEYANLMARIEVIFANEATKISHDKTDWRCKGCFKRGVCWDDDPVPVSCETCQHAQPKENGIWFCNEHQKEATKACKDYDLYRPLPL
tara:strand:+ start:19 stop:900 length:882 start_codon:yes stop_codon:yes gene_type:complete